MIINLNTVLSANTFSLRRWLKYSAAQVLWCQNRAVPVCKTRRTIGDSGTPYYHNHNQSWLTSFYCNDAIDEWQILIRIIHFSFWKWLQRVKRGIVHTLLVLNLRSYQWPRQEASILQFWIYVFNTCIHLD